MSSTNAQPRPIWRMKRFWLILTTLMCVGLLSSCSGARMLMQTAPSSPKGQAASPAISASSAAEWETQKPNIRETLEHEVYGIMPDSFTTTITARKTLTEHDYNAVIEELDLATAYVAANISEREIQYKAVIVTPKSAAGPIPIIMMENFCPNHSVIPDAGVSRPDNITFSCGDDGQTSRLMTYFFGRYIVTPPIDMIMDAGYGLAVIYPSPTFPDNAERFEEARANAPNKTHPWGAVGAWAFQFSSLSNALGQMGHQTAVTYGHSRYGKAALVAAAFDENIDGVISHQSGTGGASLSRDKKGETVADITENYPHWFTPSYSEDSLTIDQHNLLALIAPRPILLGNAKRDVWSDPEGAFRAAQGASPVYKLYGSDGLRQDKLTAFDPSADIAFWMRPGTHGVVKEDWPAFLRFMDAHFK